MSTYAAPDVYTTAHTLTTPGGTVTFNDQVLSTFQHDPSKCAGLAIGSSRPAIDDKPQTHGSIIHPTLLAGRRITLGGTILPRTGNPDPADLIQRDAMMVSLNTALVSILGADGTYAWHDVNGTAYSVTVRCEITCPNFPGGVLKSYLFGLFAADPTVA